MIRLLFLLGLLAAAVFVALVLATNPGEVALSLGQAPSYDLRIVMPLAPFVIVAILSLFAWGYIFHAWLRTLAIPKAVQRANKENRAKKGHMALSNGLVAVASGDPDEARKQARLAGRFLDNPAASLLLTAQSAQLNGQPDAAARYFEAMLDTPETRFLGLRGLIVQAVKAGDTDKALDLLQEAKRLKPKAPWVLDLEYQIRLDRGELLEAESAAAKLKAVRSVESSGGKRKHATALLAQAVEAKSEENMQAAMDRAVQASKADPSFFAAFSLAAEIATIRRNPGRAAELLLKAWSIQPSGDIANRYMLARAVKPGDFKAKLATAKGLAAARPGHWAGLALMVEAHLDLGEREEAKILLDAWDNVNQEPDLARLALRLEAGQPANNNPDEATRFGLSEGFFACTSCGTRQENWKSHCTQCGASGSVTFQSRVSPAQTARVSLEPAALIEG